MTYFAPKVQCRFEATGRTSFWYWVYFGVIICPSRDVNATTWLIQAIWRFNKLLYEYKYSTSLHTSRVLDYIIIYRRIDGQRYFLCTKCKCWKHKTGKIWLKYVLYTENMGKYRNMRKIYIGRFLMFPGALGCSLALFSATLSHQQRGAIIARTWHQRCRVTTILKMEFENWSIKLE